MTPDHGGVVYVDPERDDGEPTTVMLIPAALAAALIAGRAEPGDRPPAEPEAES